MHTLTLERPTTRDVSIVILASLIISLTGHIKIPLWFTPVPLATQNAAILLMAAFLGSKRAVAATALFLSFGALNLPVFSTGGGPSIFVGPTGGYLMGYLAASFVTGWIAERNKTALALICGNLTIYCFGAAYLSTFVGFAKSITLGIAPFLIGDLCKMLVSLKILKSRRKNS